MLNNNSTILVEDGAWVASKGFSLSDPDNRTLIKAAIKSTYRKDPLLAYTAFPFISAGVPYVTLSYPISFKTGGESHNEIQIKIEDFPGGNPLYEETIERMPGESAAALKDRATDMAQEKKVALGKSLSDYAETDEICIDCGPFLNDFIEIIQGLDL